MRVVKTYRIAVNCYSKKLAFHVQHFAQQNDVTFYELKCGGINYLVINENEKWTFLAKIPPCLELKECIVSALIEKRKSIQLPVLQSALPVICQ